MSTYRGTDGLFSFGGILVGSPQLKGLLAESATEMDIDGGAGTLTGIVAAGDTFTLATEAGTPTHTVTGTFWLDDGGDQVLGITFTPAIAAGGADDDDPVLFVTNTVTQITAWTLDSSLSVIPIVYKGIKHQEVKGGIASWSGTGSMLLDYADAVQAEILAQLATATPVSVSAGIVLVVAGTVNFYGGALVSDFNITSGEGDVVVEVSFNFAGSGAWLSQT